ncbi:methyltransferase domain-containing protein [Azoarcus sp. TTM-91]|uniref:class I SAM-dependent methyltransferase n=1 Tax=Azoarcus sp. TTM-91 TaxID=2691581 RepID=UPI00145EB53F|nr:class I SAM-dependent methyltransferase [Azoarcus sp. TTM-91]NMG33602.1 methyltransferase domain-containing protein [Azoarcus sp. TTM-91]
MSTLLHTYRGRFKYDEATAHAYQNKSSRRHRAEMKLVERALRQIPRDHRLLDLPCGGGRATLHAAALGFKVSAADYSDAMLEIARRRLREQGLDCPVEKQDIENLEYADDSFDSVLCFRLFHHFPTPEVRERAVAELCRVSRRYVLLSYFSPFSITSIKRRLRVSLGGRQSEKHATPLREVRSYFERQGFHLVRDLAVLPLLHTLHLAVFERAPAVTR